MNTGQNAAQTRTTRARTNRKVLLAGLAVSIGLHGWALGSLTIAPADLSRTAGAPEREPAQSEFEFAAIEVVRVARQPDDAEPPPIPADDRPVIAAAAPETNPEPTAASSEAGSRIAAADPGPAGTAAGAPAAARAEAGGAAESAPAPTLAERFASAMGSRPAVAMEARFAAQQPLGGWAPVEAVAFDPDAGSDRAEADEGDGSMWGTVWRRVGKTFGFGGDKLCNPIPPAKVKAVGR